jgi:hypothetical protein
MVTRANQTPLVRFVVSTKGNGELRLVLSKELLAQVKAAIESGNVTDPNYEGLVEVILDSQVVQAQVNAPAPSDSICPPQHTIKVSKAFT